MCDGRRAIVAHCTVFGPEAEQREYSRKEKGARGAHFAKRCAVGAAKVRRESTLRCKGSSARRAAAEMKGCKEGE